MIKKLLSVVAIAAATNLFAQITVTSADMPNANDSIVLSTANIAGVTVAPPGAGASWDYSTLVPTIQRYDKYDSPMTFTAPFNLIFNPSNTSYGRDNYQLTSFALPGFALTDAYDFLRETTTQWKQVGIGYSLNGTPIPFLYSSADIIYRFPMNYGNIDSCNYSYQLPFAIPGLGFFAESGKRHNIVDGWGALTTPFGTFNTLRVRSTVDAVDTVYLDALGFGTTIPRPRRIEYKWLANGMKIPVLQIDVTETFGTEIINNVQFLDSLRSDVPHVGIVESAGDNIDLMVYPNPATDYIALSVTKSENAVVTITNVVGEVVYKTTMTTLHQTISTEQLPSGIYFISLQNKNKLLTKKIIINK
jgi:hypothetical protein